MLKAEFVSKNSSMLKTWLYTSFALLAFAGNSILCRLALGEQSIDAASFTNIRLIAGILMLLVVIKLFAKTNTSEQKTQSSWRSAGYLFIYAIAFSYAYLTLSTGTGALILFAAVQLTMIIVSIFNKQKLHIIEWLGLAIAFAGFVYLVLPTLQTPSLIGFILMTLSGISWGLYTLAGKGSSQPLLDTYENFLRTLPFVAVLLLFTISQSELTNTGIVLAILSGAVTSGLGYSLWYLALKNLSSTQAAVLQLLVPVIATLGGVLIVNEAITSHLIIASSIIIFGVLLVILKKYYQQN